MWFCSGKDDNEVYQDLFYLSEKKRTDLEAENERLKMRYGIPKSSVKCPSANLFEVIDKLTSTLGLLIGKMNSIEKKLEHDQKHVQEKLDISMTQIIENTERIMTEAFSEEKVAKMADKCMRLGLNGFREQLKEDLGQLLKPTNHIKDLNGTKNAVETREVSIEPKKEEKSDQATKSSDVGPKEAALLARTTIGLHLEKPLKAVSEVKLPSRNIVALGGYRSGKNATNSIYVYNTLSNSWKTSMVKLPFPVSSHGAAFSEDQIFIIGGTSTENKAIGSNVHQLNSSLNWILLKSKLQKERKGICNLSVAVNKKIFVAGGQTDKEVWKNMDSFTSLTKVATGYRLMNDARSGAAAAVINDHIYVCGGQNNSKVLRSAEFFDLKKAEWKPASEMLEPRKGHCVVVYEKSLIVLGGNDGYHLKNTVWRMNPASRLWEPLPSMLEARSHFGAVVVEKNIIVAGGNGISGNNLKSVEIFDGKQWRRGADMPVGLAVFPTILLPEKSTAYVEKFISTCK